MSDLEDPPASWWWHPDVSPSDLKDMVAANKGRLVSLSVRTSDPLRLAAVWIKKGEHDPPGGWNDDFDADALSDKLREEPARLVCLAPFVRGGEARFAAAWLRNTGADAIESGWKPDIDPDELGVLLDEKKARLIALRSYVRNGKRRRAAAWVDNTGKQARNWWWHPSVDADQLGAMLRDNAGRLTCLDPFMENGKLRYGAAWVENDVASGKRWWWNHGLGAETLGHEIDLRCAYLPELQAYAVGDEVHLASLLYAYPLADLVGSPLVEVTGVGQLLSQTDGVSSLEQKQRLSLTLKNIGSAAVKITGGSVHINESGGFLDKHDPLLGAGELLDTATLQLAPGAQQSFAKDYGWGKGAANFVVSLLAEAGNKSQHSHSVVPIPIAGFAAPPPLRAAAPVYLGLWTNPVEVFPLWLGDKQVNWLSVAGQIVQTSRSTVRLGTWHMALEIDGKVVVDEALPFEFWTLDPTIDVVTGADGAAYLGDLTTFFAHGFKLGKVADEIKTGQLTLVADYKIGDQCGSALFQAPVKRLAPVTIAPPFEPLGANRFWKMGNGPNHDGRGSHQWPQDRYAYDIVVADETESTHEKDDAASMKDNENFYCYGKAVLAVRGGTVVSADDTNPENKGTTAVDAATSSQNYVVVKHDDGTYAGYYHLRKGKNEVEKDDPVVKGAKLGEIGNAGGSSEPHLHFAFTKGLGGRGTVTPVIFSGLKTKSGATVKAVPATGFYKL